MNYPQSQNSFASHIGQADTATIHRQSRPSFGTLSLQTRERIHTLWDALSDFDASNVDEALRYLLQNLCDLVGAQNADWFGAVRLPDALPKDPVHGWRPSCVYYLHSTESLVAVVREQTRKVDQGVTNDVVVRMVAMSGQFRACRLCDLEPPEWFESEFYREYYLDSGRFDVVYAAFPVNEDAESYFGIFRACGQSPFTEAERDTLAYALRGIKWFHRRLLLSHGLTIAATPLTPVERKVLQGLLGGLPEKEIAADLGHSYHTTHEYISNIFRKFGVSNRSALMALWLGRLP